MGGKLDVNILCHRGWWENARDKNSIGALERALDAGYGIETDIRDALGTLVVSHDPPTGKSHMTFDALLQTYVREGAQSMLALNIKSDGLQVSVREMLQAYSVDNYFVFDMSIPDTLGYVRSGMNWAVRLSEYEDGGRLLDGAPFIWLDAFERDWYTEAELSAWLGMGKKVCIVSPELHNRNHENVWQMLERVPRDFSGNLYLCTDLVDLAREAFYGG